MRLDASAWLTHFDDARTLALAGDAEGVHQARVAARRLRVWLDFTGHRALQSELRWACGALAMLRDLDVFGEVLTEAARLELRVEAVATAVEAMNSKRWAEMREDLGAVRAPRRAKAKRTLRKLERRLEKRGGALPAHDGAALHRLRRTLRRVRYAREWLGLDASELAARQESLGAVCDLLALRAFAVRLGAGVPVQLDDGIARGFEQLGPQSS